LMVMSYIPCLICHPIRPRDRHFRREWPNFHSMPPVMPGATWSAYLLQKTLRCISSEKVTAKTSMAVVTDVAVMPSATHRPSERL
jgi:hypothetical protein